jgi:hypothetical protein
LAVQGGQQRFADGAKFCGALIATAVLRILVSELPHGYSSGLLIALQWADVFCNSQARLFFHRPKFGVLDECTNATSVEVEEYLYRTAQALGITVITISQVRRPGERREKSPFHCVLSFVWSPYFIISFNAFGLSLEERKSQCTEALNG